MPEGPEKIETVDIRFDGVRDVLKCPWIDYFLKASHTHDGYTGGIIMSGDTAVVSGITPSYHLDPYCEEEAHATLGEEEFQQLIYEQKHNGSQTEQERKFIESMIKV